MLGPAPRVLCLRLWTHRKKPFCHCLTYFLERFMPNKQETDAIEYLITFLTPQNPRGFYN